MNASTRVEHPCPYCGTMLDENDEVESNVAACGPRMRHYDSECREYVFVALQSYKAEVARLREEIARLSALMATTADATSTRTRS